MDVQTKELTMFKLMCIVFFSLLMTGCAINDIGNTVNRKMDNYSIIDTIKEPQSKMDYIRFESRKTEAADTYFSVSSGVQWNDDYVVTLKTTESENDKFACLDECGVVFIKKHKQAPVPEWRHRISNEPVTLLGASDDIDETFVYKSMDIDVSAISADITPYPVYAIPTTIVENNAEGGPVYGSDGKVIGIISGFVNTVDDTGERLTYLDGFDSGFFALYIPYSELIRAWDLVKPTK